MNALDLKLFYWLNSFSGINGWLDNIIIFAGKYTYLSLIVIVALFLFLVFGKDRRRNILMVIEALAAGIASRFVVTEIIRYFYDKPRPFEVLSDIHQLLVRAPGGSFPSGHAAFFFALATTVFLYRSKWSILFLIAAFTIGVARVTGSIHWPSDILAGAVVGILTSVVVNLISKKFKPEK